MTSAREPDLVYRFAQGHSDAPTLVLLHGTGSDENDLIPLGQALEPNASLLSPRGQVRENGMPRWFRRHAEGVFDVDDLVARTHELAGFLTAAVRRHRLDPAKLIVVGFSNGANIAVAMLLLHPEVFRGAVLLAPMSPPPDMEAADLSAVGVFIGAGRADPIAPPGQAEELATLLSEQGAAVEMRWHPGGHGVDQSVLSAAQAWLGKFTATIASDPLP